MSAILEVRNLSHSYGQLRALDGVSLDLLAGEIVAVIGPNGSGKSTLIKSVLGYLPASGEVRWDGQTLARLGRKKLARLAAYLPQSPVIEEQQTVGEALRLGRAPFQGAFGIESVHDLDVVGRVAAMLGIESLLDRYLDELSGGQRQAVLVGRCLVQEPKAMLLDEPNTYLDLKHQVELARLMRKLAREQSMAVLMALHDLNLAAAMADRLILMDGGKIARTGTPAEVLEPALLERIYGVAISRIEQSPGSKPLVFPSMV